MKSKPTALGLYLAVFLMMTGVGMIVAVLPRTYIALSGTPHTVGVLAAAFAATYLLVQLGVGRAADRCGLRRWLVAGYLVCALSGFCFFVSANALMLILGRLVQGLGEAPAWSLAPAILAREYPRRPGRVIGGYSAVLHVGLACGPAVGIVARLFWPEKAVFALFGVLCLVGGAVLAATLEADIRRPSGKGPLALPRDRPATVATDRRLRAVLPAVALYGAGYGAFLTVVPLYLETVKGFGDIGLGFFFTAFYTAVGLAALVTGCLSDRLGRRGFLIAGLSVGGWGLAFLPEAGGLALVGLLLASVLGLGVFGLSALAYMNDRVAADLKGTLAGCYFLSWGLGMFLGPLAVGWMDAVGGSGAGLQSYGVAAGLYGLLLVRALYGGREPGRR